jgi:hypothetical protein
MSVQKGGREERTDGRERVRERERESERGSMLQCMSFYPQVRQARQTSLENSNPGT